MPRRSVILFAAACAAIALAVVVTTLLVVSARDQQVSLAETGAGTPAIGGDFQLVNQDGQAVDQSILTGKWSLVFFGFTYCPDFCPTTLAVLDAAQNQLGDKADDIQILFVSVDPERDTPQVLKDYLSSDGFPETVTGLTGSPDQIASAARVYRAAYEKVGEGETYTMNHSLTVYLMGPDGQFRAALAQDMGPERSAQLIARIMQRG